MTVNVALPTAAPVTVTMPPDTPTAARAVSDEATAYSNSSPSGSVKCAATSISTASPT